MRTATVIVVRESAATGIVQFNSHSLHLDHSEPFRCCKSWPSNSWKRNDIDMLETSVNIQITKFSMWKLRLQDELETFVPAFPSTDRCIFRDNILVTGSNILLVDIQVRASPHGCLSVTWFAENIHPLYMIEFFPQNYYKSDMFLPNRFSGNINSVSASFSWTKSLKAARFFIPSFVCLCPPGTWVAILFSILLPSYFLTTELQELCSRWCEAQMFSFAAALLRKMLYAVGLLRFNLISNCVVIKIYSWMIF